MPDTTNTKDYWDHRFATDWGAEDGPAQSRFFSRIALRLMPAWFTRYLGAERPLVCDWGCAEGDGTDELAGLTGQDRTIGVDFSPTAVETARRRYPRLRFECADWLSAPAPSAPGFDVVFSSNTLEHFRQPFGVLARLGQNARDFIVLLLPFRETERHPEHFASFDDEGIPLSPIPGWSLVHARSMATGGLEQSMWAGEQLLLIYARDEACQRLGLALADACVSSLHGEGDPPAMRERIAELEATVKRLRSRQAEHQKQLGQVAQELQETGIALAGKETEVTLLKAQLESRSKKIADLETGIATLSGELASTSEALAGKDLQLAEQQAEIARHADYVEDKEAYIAALGAVLTRQGEQLNSLARSISWRCTAPLRYIVSLLLPGRYPMVRVQPFSAASLGLPAPSAPAESDRKAAWANFNPYANLTALKPIPVELVESAHEGFRYPPGFSAISTVLNESAGIDGFLASIGMQSLLPDELIIVDGGSQDDTVARIDAWAARTGIAVRVIVVPGASIANGRNIALSGCRHEVVVAMDAGCELDPDYCRELVGALADHPDADLVCGIYHARQHGPWSHQFIYDWSRCNWNSFLPSSRSLLIRKSVWAACGGYPEHLTRTGEDTLFDLNYRRFSRKWVVSTRAFVFWHAPDSEVATDRLARAYAIGDGESGFGDFAFYKYLKRHLRGVPLKWPTSFGEARFSGYLEGRQRRAARAMLDPEFRGVALVLSGVPISDSGGGQRCTQLALEFAHQGYKVIFVNIFPSFEASHQVYLDINPARLDLYALADFDVHEALAPYAPAMSRSLVLVEFPHPDLLPILQGIRSWENRPCIIYDHIDNWQTTLGWSWYTPEAEQAIVAHSDRLAASAATLKQQLARTHGRGVHLVPNAYNARLFDPANAQGRPDDLPDPHRPIVMYIGALWGEWFDWDLLAACAAALPDHEFVMIGNTTEAITARTAALPNVRYLGLKPQRDLPAYLHHAHACIIPFKEDEVTRYVNPLKVYEYLAMQVPVVSTDMPGLAEMPGVVVRSTAEGFVRAIREADRQAMDHGAGKAYLEQNNWSARVNKLVAIASGTEFPLSDIGDLPAAHLSNPISHWVGVLPLLGGKSHPEEVIKKDEPLPHEPELHLARHFTRPHDLVLDIGANVGQTLASVRAVNPGVAITCFEPNPFLAAMLREAAESLGQVQVHEVALSASDAERTLWIPAVDGMLVTPLASFDRDSLRVPGQAAYLRSLSLTGDVRLVTVEVPLRRGDGFGLKPTLIKVDVEGFELEVVRGLLDTIGECRPVCIVERNYQTPELARLMRSCGYRAYRFEGETEPLSVLEVPEVAITAEDFPLNLVFIHDDARAELAALGMRLP